MSSPITPTTSGATTFLQFQAAKTLHTAHGPQQLDLSFQLKKGDILALYGPSGAGKTTILRILAGLTHPTTGHIQTENEIWLDTSRKLDLPTRHRSIGFVFQDFALFPHLSVRQQLEFALPPKADTRIIAELLEMMELEALQNQKPAALSGGQQQRVALARAIARRPRLLLLDEPLSALDDEMRSKLQDFILKAHQHYDLTTILVSHHLPEIFRLASEVIVLEKGRIQKKGKVADVFHQDKASDKFKATGEIIDITTIDVACIISVLSGNSTIKIVVTPAEAALLHIGQKIIVTSQTFNPIILPI
ncbi:MAG: ATP-binding cassette domain-containing protein [Bacteroidetes bacterium]|nr:ATP-binding cassette domain-containing protein [Bacteroidota bacterium]